MNKRGIRRGMKRGKLDFSGKSYFIAGFIVALLFVWVFASGVFAQEANNDLSGSNESEDGADDGLTPQEKAEVSEKVDEVAKPEEIAGEVKKYVEEFVAKRGINAGQINDVSQVDFNSLPKEVNIENVGDANLAIYQVDYNETESSSESNETNEAKQLFVVTYSVEKLRSQGDIIISQDKREFLNFGVSEEKSGSGFLKTATGVEGSLENGYVMMRSGSITGISTSLDIVNSTGSSSENIEIIIYKNGEAIRFGNNLDAESSGVKKDYDVQSKGVVEFEAGDIISAYVKAESESSWENVITLVEITTTD